LNIPLIAVGLGRRLLRDHVPHAVGDGHALDLCQKVLQNCVVVVVERPILVLLDVLILYVAIVAVLRREVKVADDYWVWLIGLVSKQVRVHGSVGGELKVVRNGVVHVLPEVAAGEEVLLILDVLFVVRVLQSGERISVT
jgi:hypothetical protein